MIVLSLYGIVFSVVVLVSGAVMINRGENPSKILFFVGWIGILLMNIAFFLSVIL